MRRLTLTAAAAVLMALVGTAPALAADSGHSQDRVLTARLVELPAPDGGVLRLGLAAEDAQFAGSGQQGYLDVAVEHLGGTDGYWRAGSDTLARSAFSYTPNLHRAVLRPVVLACVEGCTGSVEVSAQWQGEGADLDLGRSHLVDNDGACDHYVVQRVYSDELARGSLVLGGATVEGDGGLRLESRVRATDRSC